jgi:serine/threonine-protein kinase
MAPEQLRGDAVDQRADVYALGVVLYELLTGTMPFEDETPYSVAVLVLTASVLPPSTINPDVWPALEHAVLTALARDAAARYPDMHRFAEALHEALDRPQAFAATEAPTLPAGSVGLLEALALSPADTAAFSPGPDPNDQTTTPGSVWTATTGPRGAGAALWRRLRLPPPPSWRKPALLAGLVLLLLVGLATGGTLIVWGGAHAPPSVGSRPTATITIGPVTTTTPAQPTASTTATVKATTAPTAGATATATTAATATATATATPLPTLTLAPTPLVLPGQNTCTATQTITNNTSQTVGWTWKQSIPAPGVKYWVNGVQVNLPKDMPPGGVAPGIPDTLVVTADCKPQSYPVLLTTTLGDVYTFAVEVT